MHADGASFYVSYAGEEWGTAVDISEMGDKVWEFAAAPPVAEEAAAAAATTRPRRQTGRGPPSSPSDAKRTAKR
jgi:hypothetical protein